MNGKQKEHRKSFVSAKLVFYDWGWRENVIYKLNSSCSDKKKGILMINAIRNYFGISKNDIDNDEKLEITREFRNKEPINWTRGAKGQIVSRFAKNLKEDFK